MPIKTISLNTPRQNTQQRSLDNQRRMAELLQNQALEPVNSGRMVGRTYVPMHPLEGVAQMGKVLAANYRMSAIDEKEKKYDEEQSQKLGDALKNYGELSQPTPATPDRENPYSIYTGENPVTPGTPEIKPDMHAANMALVNSGNSTAMQFGLDRMFPKPDGNKVVPKGGVLSDDQGNPLLSNIPEGGELESKILQAQQLNQLIDDPNTPPEQRQGYKDQLSNLQRPPKQTSSTVNISREPRFKIEDTPQGLVRVTANGVEKLYEDDNKTTRMIRSTADPEHQAKKAKYKIIGKTYGEDTAKAYTDLPKTTNSVYRATRQLRALPKHPAFSSSVGMSWRPKFKHIAGSPEKDFHEKVEQLMNGAFLQAFQALKGGGHITEIEGEKATKAKARLNTDLSEEGFKEAINDYIDVLEEGLRLQELKANQVDTQALGISEGERYQTTPTGKVNTGGGIPTPDDIAAEMKRRGL